MTMAIERVLRVVAMLIAVLALIDPSWTFASRDRPVVALSVVDSPSLALPFAGADTRRDEVQRVRARVAAALGGGSSGSGGAQFDVRDGPVPDAAAQVFVGDGSFPVDTAVVEGGSAPVAVAAVAIETAASPSVRVRAIDAPRHASLATRMHVTATIEARGMAGRSSAVVLRADGIEMSRTTHAWSQSQSRAPSGTPSQAIETAVVTLDAVPFRTGLTRLSVVATDNTTPKQPQEPEKPEEEASTAVDVTDEPLGVLFVDARPSWMTRFARQALDGDARFAVKALSRVSRGLTTATTDTPQALTLASLEPFAVVVVGAPEALTPADVDALRQFARLRGGAIIFAPDQRPSGAYVDLLPARAFDERLLDQPAAAAAPGSFAASELAVPRELLPGAETLARVGDPRSGAPIVIASPLGDGEVLFIGALDAWRFRDALDRHGPRDPARTATNTTASDTSAAAAATTGTGSGFDTTWRQLVATVGARVPPPIDVAIDPPLAAPGGRVAVHIRLQKTLINANGSVPPLVAHLRRLPPATTSTPSSTPSADARTRDLDSVRLWPTEQQGQFAGGLNAPVEAGVYAVSVELTGGGSRAVNATGDGRVLVAPHVTPATATRGGWDGLKAFVEARGGVSVSSADVPRLIEHLQQTGHAATIPRARHPFRSTWWMVPFAACLGGEWWLRRRRGQR